MARTKKYTAGENEEDGQENEESGGVMELMR